MTALRALADDAVLVSRLHLPATLDPGRVTSQLAAIPTPATRRWIFVRQLTIRPGPAGLGRAVRDALERLAQTGPQERVEFPDFPSMAAALGRDLRDGIVARRWFWRALDLPAEPGAALAAFMRADPLHAWEALVAWQEAGLLPALWPLLTDQAATAVTLALTQATGAPPLDAPPDETCPVPNQRPPDHPIPPPFPQAAAFWYGALPPNRPTLRELAVWLSLLRWHPTALAHPAARSHAIPAMRAALRGTTPPAPAQTRKPFPLSVPPSPPAASISPHRQTSPAPPHLPAIQSEPFPTTSRPGPEPIPTAFGGVLFLLNALERIGIRRRLIDWPSPHIPSGFALLHGLARRSAVPTNEPLLQFLAAHFDPIADPGEPPLLDALHAELLALFPSEPEQPPGLFFLRQNASLIPAPLHLDLYLATSAIDLQVRRAALDRDPGWVPWFGGVVHFHYPSIPTRWAAPR